MLRYGGESPFVEHGRALEAGVRGWQDRLTPAWEHVAGSRRLDRAIDGLVLAARGRLDDSRTDYSRGPKPMAFVYEGQARPGRGDGPAAWAPGRTVPPQPPAGARS